MYRKHNKIIIVVISSMLKLDISTAIDLFTPGFRQTTHKGPSRSRSYGSWVNLFAARIFKNPVESIIYDVAEFSRE